MHYFFYVTEQIILAVVPILKSVRQYSYTIIPGVFCYFRLYYCWEHCLKISKFLLLMLAYCFQSCQIFIPSNIYNDIAKLLVLFKSHYTHSDCVKVIFAVKYNNLLILQRWSLCRALALAPFVDRGLSWFTVKLKFESQGKVCIMQH